MDRRNRLGRMDALRGLAAVSVVAFHSGIGQNHPHIGAFFANLSIGMPLFFMLSGCLLYRPYAVRNAGGEAPPRLVAYFWRRFLRIVPAYWIALTIAAIVLGEGYVFRTPRYYGFSQIYSAQHFFYGLLPAWTLDIEVTFYLFLPVWAFCVGWAARHWSDHRLKIELGAMAALVAFSYCWQIFELRFSLPQYLDYFALGMSITVVRVALDGRPEWPRAIAALARRPEAAWFAAAVVIVVISRIVPSGQPVNEALPIRVLCHALFGVFAVLVISAVVFVREERGPLRWLMQRRALARLGLISYGVFLYHEPILRLLERAGVYGWPSGTALAFFMGLPLAICAAELSWRLIEQPAMRQGRRVPRHRPAAMPAEVPVAAAVVGAPAPAEAPTG